MTTSVGASLEPRNRVPPLGPPPLQSSIKWKYHKENGKFGKEHQWIPQRTKGCILKHTRMGKNSAIISLLSKFLLLQCFTIAKYISLKWEMEGRIRAFPSIWKAKDQAIRYLMRKTPIFVFVFEHKT